MEHVRKLAPCLTRAPRVSPLLERWDDGGAQGPVAESALEGAESRERFTLWMRERLMSATPAVTSRFVSSASRSVQPLLTPGFTTFRPRQAPPLFVDLRNGPPFCRSKTVPRRCNGRKPPPHREELVDFSLGQRFPRSNTRGNPSQASMLERAQYVYKRHSRRNEAYTG